jgi:hypothetical protein
MKHGRCRFVVVFALVSVLVFSGALMACAPGATSKQTALDTAKLAELHTPYVGNNSAVGAILDVLPTPGGEYKQSFFAIGEDYGTGYAPNTLTVYYEPSSELCNDLVNSSATDENAKLLFNLIDNLEEVSFAARTTPSEDGLDQSAYTSRISYARKDQKL